MLPLLTFLATHRPMVVDLSPPPPSVVTGPEYGPGVKRLDPGTVNLPIRVSVAPTTRPKKGIVIWMKTTPARRHRPGS